MLVGDGLEASWGAQLASQKVCREGEDVVVEVEVDPGSKGKCTKDSKEGLGVEVKCSPNSIVE
jgi:hypothetical protein